MQAQRTLFHSSERRKKPIPLKLGEFLPGAPIRPKFHPACRIQDAKLPWERKPKSTLWYSTSRVFSLGSTHYLALAHTDIQTPYRHADTAGEPGDGTAGKASPTTPASRYLVEGTRPSPSAEPSSAVPSPTRRPTCQMLGFMNVSETTNPAKVGALMKKNYKFWHGFVGLFLLPVKNSTFCGEGKTATQYFAVNGMNTYKMFQ